MGTGLNIQFYLLNAINGQRPRSRDSLLTLLIVFSCPDRHPPGRAGAGVIQQRGLGVAAPAKAAPCSPRSVAREGQVDSLVAGDGALRGGVGGLEPLIAVT